MRALGRTDRTLSYLGGGASTVESRDTRIGPISVLGWPAGRAGPGERAASVGYWPTAVAPGENAAERHDCAPHQAVADPFRPLS
jgi:hypothetical protein